MPIGVLDLGKEIQWMAIDVRKTYCASICLSVGGQAPQPAARGQIQANPFIHDVNQRYARMLLRRNWLGSTGRCRCHNGWLMGGGARRDRTDDLKLAKLPLSNLSYGPG